MYLSNYPNDLILASTTNSNLDIWQYVTITRQGEYFRLFIDGVKEAETVTDVVMVLDQPTNFELGFDYVGGSEFLYQGFIDDFFILKGKALWTEDFTPPTIPFRSYIKENKFEDFIGEVQVKSLLPTGDGTSQSMTPIGESLNYQCIDDSTGIDESTLVRTHEIGSIDTYQFANLTTSEPVLAVIPCVTAKRDGFSNKELSGVTRDSDNYESLQSEPLSSVYKTVQIPMTINPVTNAPWDSSEVNSQEFGIKLKI